MNLVRARRPTARRRLGPRGVDRGHTPPAVIGGAIQKKPFGAKGVRWLIRDSMRAEYLVDNQVVAVLGPNAQLG